MTQKLLYAHILLDRSGSMESCRDSTIDAVNEYVSALAKDPNIDSAVSLTLFDCGSGGRGLDLEEVYDGKPASTLPKLTRDTFVPRGSTPLNDAIGKVVARMKEQWHRPGESIALVIMTDGHENASREFTADAVKKLIEGVQKEDNWLVIYLGANQDAFKEGVATRGTMISNTMSYNTANVKAAMASVARRTGAYGMTGSLDSGGFTEEERTKAKAAQN